MSFSQRNKQELKLSYISTENLKNCQTIKNCATLEQKEEIIIRDDFITKLMDPEVQKGN